MAREEIYLGLYDGDPTADDLRAGGAMINRMFIEQYALNSQTTNAGADEYNFPGATDEQRIALADADAVLNGDDRLYIPAFMIPYDITQCPASVGVQRVREYGNGADYDVWAYGILGDDTTNAGPAFKAAIAAIEAAGSGVLAVPRGTYRFVISSDAESILLPSNCEIRCSSGVTFRWGELGSPLFVAVHKENIVIDGATFEWDGTLVDVLGDNLPSRFGWTGGWSRNVFPAHILSLGSDNVRVRHCACRVVGDAPTLANQSIPVFAGFFHKSTVAGVYTTSHGNSVTDCLIDDVVFGVLLIGQDNFRVQGITTRRMPGEHLLGTTAGDSLAVHTIYLTGDILIPLSKSIIVRDIIDHGEVTGAAPVPATRTDTTVQIKYSEGAIIDGITTKRPGGFFSASHLKRSIIDNIIWQPTTAATNGMGTSVLDSIGVEDSVFRGITAILPDNVNVSALSVIGMNRCVIEMYVSEAHTSQSVSSITTDGCSDNKIKMDFVVRNATGGLPVWLSNLSHRNYVEVNPIGQNQRVRNIVASGCLGNVVRIRDNVSCVWTNASQVLTEADSPAMGFEAIRKTKAYRIGTSTNPTTTWVLPRAGVWTGTVQIIEASGAHLLGGMYRIAWDTGTLQSVELMGTQWTKGASAPTVLNLAVSTAGLVTVTSTAGSAAWDMVYDWTSAGNNRYADY